MGMLLLLLALLPCANADVIGSFELKAPEGTYIGHDLKGASYFPYIAYAEPPVGKLRWRKVSLLPAAKQRKDPVACPSVGDDTFGGEKMKMQEDCLYLNVWAPRSLPPDARGYPVILLIHGGGLVAGNGVQSFYDGSVFARHGVVFVSFNYRLHELGYGPKLSPEKGSLGLLDQANALEWVAKRIRAFGGDPDRVYLMGHSKGAEAVTGLMETGLAGPGVKGGIALSFGRHFDQSGNFSIDPRQRVFLPGERDAPWEKILQMKTEMVLYVPEAPHIRLPGEASHRFQLLASSLYDERFWGDASDIYCQNAWALRQYWDYIDGYFFVLHAGRYEHGTELKELFRESSFGRAFRDYLVRFVHEGRPPARRFAGAPKPWTSTLEVTHFFPWFSLKDKFRDEWKEVQCVQEPGIVGSQVSHGWRRLEAFLNFFGYGRRTREWVPDAEDEK